MKTAATEKIYLDNAATSFPKPEAVYRTVDLYMRSVGASAGRGAYREAAEAERVLEEVRGKLLALLGAPRGRVVFTLNATDAINQALKGTLAPGDHVITTCLDHNSILRPLNAMESEGRISVTRVSCSPEGIVDPDDVERAVCGKTRLIATLHGSNILGTLNPVEAIGRIARERGLLFLLDAAQTIGSRPVLPEKIGAQMVAFPGHKGLLGPLGTGALYFDESVDIAPLREGGTGSRSESDSQPEFYPDRWEAGSHNLPGIAGLGAGLDYILERSVADIHAQKTGLTQRFLDGIAALEGVTLHGPRDGALREGVFSLNVAGLAPAALGTMMDIEYGIKGRAGLHCAPLAHRAAGTLETGSFRLSLGPFNCDDHLDRALSALQAAAGGTREEREKWTTNASS
jgi:cysteine desulfurase / selenocysteine lyase